MERRLAAATVIGRVLAGESLSRALPQLQETLPVADRAAVQALSYGVLRNFESLDFVASQLLSKPLKKKDEVIRQLLLVGLFELQDGRTASHAVVNETVAVVKKIRPWASGLVNACLRRFQREQEGFAASLQQNQAAATGLPDWLYARLQQDWGDEAGAIASALGSAAPMTLRVNLHKVSRQQYQQQLTELGITATVHPLVASALVLDSPMDVSQLPGFAVGLVSVQDAAAQLAADLVAAQAGHKVLDACAAPGGKMAHLLESCAGQILLTAVESDAERAPRLQQTLQRLGYSADVVVADAAATAQWWDGVPFERILLDAPCSATGTIRRNPDIKRHRKPGDIAALVQQQRRLLDALWPLLASGGELVYVTCSILKEENELQIASFLQTTADALVKTIDAGWGRVAGAGRQIMPGIETMDGFFYACLKKH